MRFNKLYEKKAHPEQTAVSSGVQTLGTDQWMGTYKWSKDVAGHDGDKQHAPESPSGNDVYTDKAIVVGYSDADDKMTKAAMNGKVKQTVGSGSEEPENVNAKSPLSKNEDVSKGLPDHLKKHFDKDGNPIKGSWKDGKWTPNKDPKYQVKDVTPKGYGPTEDVEEAQNIYHLNRTGFARGPRDSERHDLDVSRPAPQEWALKINGKVWSKDGKTVTFNSKEQALKVRQSLLAKRPDLEVGLVTRGGTTESKDDTDVGAQIADLIRKKNSASSPVARKNIDSQIAQLKRQRDKMNEEQSAAEGLLNELTYTKPTVFQNKTGKFVAWVRDNKDKVYQYFGDTADEALNKLNSEVLDKHNAKANNASKISSNSTYSTWITGDVARNKAGIDKNVSEVWIKVEPETLIISKSPMDGFKKARGGSQHPTSGFQFNLKGSELEQLGLKPSNRYEVSLVDQSKDGSITKFKISHHSYYYDSGDKLPGGTNSLPLMVVQQTGRNSMAEGTPRVDSLVTKGLGLMRGPTWLDAVAAIKYQVGERDYRERKQFYDFFVQQLVDMYAKKDVAEGVRDLGYDAQSLIMKLRRDVEEKRLQPTRQAVLSAARELAGDMDFAPELLVQQVLGKGVEEAHGNSKIYDKCWTGYRKVPGKTRGEDGSCEKIKEDEVEEAEVRHDRYMRSHGKKASGGHGSWMFTNKEYGEPGDDETFTAPPGKFSDAAKHAKKWAKEKGHYSVYAMEDGLDEASTADMRAYFAQPSNQNPIKPSTDKRFPSKEAYLRWLQQQKKPTSKDSTVDEDVIYRLDKENPMSDTEVLVIGGAGRYSLDGLRAKARREAEQLAKDLTIDHGGAFRRSAQNVRQLQNTLNTIVAAYDELSQLRKLGGVRSKGIKDEDATVVREGLELMEKWTQKYKNSINCSDPKGFSQKAHCAGKKK